MAKRKPKSDAPDDPTSFDPATFDAASSEPVALAVATDGSVAPPLAPVPEPAPQPSPPSGSPGRAAVSVDPDGRVTYTVPTNATASAAAPNPDGDGDGDAEKRLTNPFGVRADHEAKVGLLEDRWFRQMQIKFGAKPSDEVRQVLRDAGWQWRSPQQAWTKQIDPEAAWRTRAEATALFDRVAGMVRDELGLGREVG